ncbi:hypothetical protein BRD03_14745 [Halobacteriales archaeon QS_9_68_17]|nr:MAG: hypothetical protein BRD03_14745 [Halobacteriales archaeon QS_9_68_17]
MGERAITIVDTNVLLDLATPVVDGRSRAPTGEDPLKTVLTGYDVHVPSSVLGEVSKAQGSDDLLSAAADLVFRASHHLTTHDVDAEIDDPLDFGLDRGESHGIWLANELSAAMFVTDEFNTTNYLFVSLALNDRNILFTTPHILCVLTDRGLLTPQYVDAVLTYYIETKQWDRQYVDQLRNTYLTE